MSAHSIAHQPAPVVRQTTVQTRPLLTNKELFVDFCQREKSVPLYLQPWWMDAVCAKGRWDVALSFDKSGQIDGALTYYIVKLKGVFSAVVLPELTPNAGIWMRLPDAHKSKDYSKAATTKKILDNLIAQLPNTCFYHQKFHHTLADWQPFYWNGFNGTTHYTYILDNLDNLADVYDGFKGSVRTDIKKAEKCVIVEISDDVMPVFESVSKSLKHQNMTPPFQLDTLKKLDKALAERQKRKIYVARDAQGVVHGAIYVVYNSHSVHYLLGGSDPEKRQSAAKSILLWTAIQDASAAGYRIFDFEGSMIPSVEYAFRNFGAKQTPYFRITKPKNRLFEAIALFFPNYK